MHDDIMDKMVDEVHDAVAETCARFAEVNRINRPDSDFQRGYNAAVADIAMQIRELVKKRKF